MKLSSIPKSGRKGSVVYLNTRYGKVARQYVRPRNPRTPEQQLHRNNVRAVSGRWRTLTPEQHAAWRIAAAIWIRTCQHIDGWTDVPEVTRARVRAPAPWSPPPGLAPRKAEVIVSQPPPFWRPIGAYRPVCSPDTRRRLPVVPLIAVQRYYGEAPARLRRGSGGVPDADGGMIRAAPSVFDNAPARRDIALSRF